MIAKVKEPAIILNPIFIEMTNIKEPNNPYTILGIPDNVSVVNRITLTSLDPRLAYSTR